METQEVINAEVRAIEVAPTGGMIMTTDAAVLELEKLQAFVRSVMKEGTDFGPIPGAGQRKVLLKPGAEKLCEVYGLAPEIEVDDKVEDWHATVPFLMYRVKCKLVSKRTGAVVAEGVGSCNSKEVKYRYRTEYWNREGQPSGEGWEKNKWAKWQRKVENTETADLANTILKMAKKRAVVDATLSATRSSDLFTQDIEDMAHEEAGSETRKNPRPAKPATGKPIPCQGENCGKMIEGYESQKGRVYTPEQIAAYSQRDFGLNLCKACGFKAKAAKEEQQTSDAQPSDEGAGEQVE